MNYQKINKIKQEAESHIIDIQASVQHYIQEQNDKLILTAQKINQVIPEKQKVRSFFLLTFRFCLLFQELLSLLERVKQLEGTIHNIDKELANKQANNQAIVLSHLNRSKEMSEYANAELNDSLTNAIETKNVQIKELSTSIQQHKVNQNESAQSLKHTIDQLSQSILEHDNSQVALYDEINSTFKKQTDVSVRFLISFFPKNFLEYLELIFR